MLNFDFCILGGGAVGLSVAYQLKKHFSDKSVVIIEKEKAIGLHSSGRNSGVLHSGLYYPPGSLKAKVCISGSKRLQSWIQERNLPLNRCGKIIIPQRIELDQQLDLLYERGVANGCDVKYLDENDLAELFPSAKSSSGRALWSPSTSVTKPLTIINTMLRELLEIGVVFLNNQSGWTVSPKESFIKLKNESVVNYGHLFNCAGLYADKVAHQFGIANHYKIMPFKGMYWELKKDSGIDIPCNLYPVPDLQMPFLGVHFTPSGDHISAPTIGPTATFAFGRQNYSLAEGIEPLLALANSWTLLKQYIFAKGGMRHYVHQQSLLAFKFLMLKEAKNLIPDLQSKDVKISQKVGMRAQLFNIKKDALENDFVCINYLNTTHVLNAISPAFTASFALADHILEYAKLLPSSLGNNHK